MDDATLKEFEKQYRDLSNARIEAELEKYLPESAQRLALAHILAERQEAAEAGEKERFDKRYAQTERHHRDSVRSARIAAGISILGALAAWASVWYSRVQTRATPDAFYAPLAAPTASVTSSPPNNILQPTVVPEEAIAKQASEETKADAEAKPTPEATEDTEEMNDRYDPSPDEVLFAATRLIPDRVYIQRHNLDAVAVAIFRAGEQELTVVARHDFQGRVITYLEWSPDSKFLLFTTASSSGHSPWHAAAFLFCTADNSFRDVDAAIGSVVSPKFRFEQPDIAVMVVV